MLVFFLASFLCFCLRNVYGAPPGVPQADRDLERVRILIKMNALLTEVERENTYQNKDVAAKDGHGSNDKDQSLDDDIEELNTLRELRASLQTSVRRRAFIKLLKHVKSVAHLKKIKKTFLSGALNKRGFWWNCPYCDINKLVPELECWIFGKCKTPTQDLNLPKDFT